MLIYRVTDIINKTEIGKYMSVHVSMCKVLSYMACQRGTSRKRVGSNGGSGAVGARGEPGGEREVEGKVEGKAEGVPLTTSLLRPSPRGRNTVL